MKGALLGGMAAGAALAMAARRAWRNREQMSPRTVLEGQFSSRANGIPHAVFQATGVEMTEGNTVGWCEDAHVFQALEHLVVTAQRSIHFDVYIWKPTGPGTRLVDRVAARAAEGIAVRVLVDPLGSREFETELAPRLIAAGAQIRYFRPPRRHPLKLWGRNHRKLVVVDGHKGITGGFGIAEEWLRWRDSNVCVEGPVVRQMQQAFAAHWLESGGTLLPPEEFAPPNEAGAARAAFVSSMDVKGFSKARWVTHIALAAARERLWIANAYFVPPPDILAALRRSRGCGVDVRVLVPGPYLDHVWVGWLQRASYLQLTPYDVRVFEYLPSMLHAKTALIDRQWVVVGSTNLDPLSQNVLEEGSLIVDDAAFASQFERRWERDLCQSREVDASDVPRAIRAMSSSAPRELIAP